MADSFRLVPAGYDHPDAVALTEQAQEYYVAIYGGRDSDPLTVADFAPPRGGFLLGYWGSEPAAMGGWHRVGVDPVPSDWRTAQVRRMFVRPDLRGRGLGRRVLRAIEEDASAAGVEMLILTTGQPQTEANRLYRSAGYRDIPGFGHYADVPTAVHLGKRLTEAD